MDINFINGKAIIKIGRNIIAKIYDRRVFYPANNIKSDYSIIQWINYEVSDYLCQCSV